MTYGAGGSTQARTHATVARIVKETSLVPAAHLTCVGASRERGGRRGAAYWEAGVRHIVALRGDPPPGALSSRIRSGYHYAADLVAGLKRVADFEISVAAYPETHPQRAQPRRRDLDNLKRKLDAGATRAITQYFFDTLGVPGFPRPLPRGRDQGADRAGHHAGVQFRAGGPVQRDVRRERAGLARRTVRRNRERPETRRMVAAVVAAEQVRLLQANGVDEFHFYTLNRPDLTYAIAHILGVRPAASATAA